MTLKQGQDLGRLLSQFYQPLSEKISVFPKKKRAIVIAGPTASGKTRLSLEIARIIGGEIISADSMQVYRGMDIGTAKASSEERQEVPHHLVDIRDIHEPFNVVQYYQEAHRTLREVFTRGNVPIIVGGSGFYLRVFLYGPPASPPSDPEIRKQLEKQLEEKGAEVMYERLQMLDPEYAQTITEGDKHKIIRALEIIAISERKVSDFPKPQAVVHPECDFRSWFIYYPREILYPKIELRCEEMIKQGFIEEVRRLKEKGLGQNPLASQAIGYKQCLEFLETKESEEDYRAFLFEFKKATRNYAKRQFTWFKKEPFFRWMNLDEIDRGKLVETILQDFEQGI